MTKAKTNASVEMKTYTVKIFRNNEYVDTQTVQARDAWNARTVAMAWCRVPMNGAMVSFEITESN